MTQGCELDGFGIEGLALLPSRVMEDERGCFMEAYRRSVFREFGIEEEFVQDNLSISKKGVLRGLHFQIAPHEQGKLVRVLSGEVFDVAVDLRLDSPSFGRWAAVTLSAKEGLAFYIPRGFAHGFMVLSEEATFLYKCTSEYAPERESGLRWDDPDVAIEWPLRPRLVSAKDTSLPRLSELGLGTMNR